ncbi:PREDICTED: phospholipase A2 inhibitor LNF2-like [Thamnophis sirtalis]|uniref:Phospholipase A2 inhibitor LNF2-like n=1 Tax=Thamnophis sirtalis TaxID=35019 RepID=A0A6I9YZM2_9SAUR|nr:PREDICTED: phospholipase A2 inhibitor LNF2-like [Thamnophis sirtalis]
METSLVICLLTASITLVFAKSRECIVCQSIGKDCQGDKKECSAPGDKCGITSMEQILGSTSNAVNKSCIPPKDCDKGLAVLDLGNNQLIRGFVFCCKDDQCTNPPSWPSRKIVTTNNKRCPACYTQPKEQSGCEAKVINCTGEDETYCAEVFLQKKEGGKTMTTTMKGCANKAFCEKLEILTIESQFTLLPNSNCNNAAGAVSSTTGLLGLFLLAQAGLIFS